MKYKVKWLILWQPITKQTKLERRNYYEIKNL